MQRNGFSVVVIATLGLFGFFGLVLLEPEWFGGLLGQATVGHVLGHFREPQHRIHDLTFSLLLATAAVGMLAQVRRPSQNVAGQLMALIPIASLVLVVVLTNTQVLQLPWLAVGTAVLLAASLHPNGRGGLGSLRVSRADRSMLALIAIAAVPLLAFALSNIGLERTVADDHAALGHYGFLAAFGFTVIGVGLLTSLRPDGWRLTAWVTGLLPVLLGLASVTFSDASSRLDLGWALAAIAWGVVFIGAAERTRSIGGADPSLGDAGPDPLGRSTTNTSPRVVIAAALVVVLVVLFAFMHLAGGGPGLH